MHNLDFAEEQEIQQALKKVGNQPLNLAFNSSSHYLTVAAQTLNFYERVKMLRSSNLENASVYSSHLFLEQIFDVIFQPKFVNFIKLQSIAIALKKFAKCHQKINSCRHFQ